MIKAVRENALLQKEAFFHRFFTKNDITGWDAQAITKMVFHLNTRTFSADEVLYWQGIPPPGMFFLLRGTVLLYRNPSKTEQVSKRTEYNLNDLPANERRRTLALRRSCEVLDNLLKS